MLHSRLSVAQPGHANEARLDVPVYDKTTLPNHLRWQTVGKSALFFLVRPIEHGRGGEAGSLEGRRSAWSRSGVCGRPCPVCRQSALLPRGPDVPADGGLPSGRTVTGRRRSGTTPLWRKSGPSAMSDPVRDRPNSRRPRSRGEALRPGSRSCGPLRPARRAWPSKSPETFTRGRDRVGAERSWPRRAAGWRHLIALPAAARPHEPNRNHASRSPP